MSQGGVQFLVAFNNVLYLRWGIQAYSVLAFVLGSTSATDRLDIWPCLIVM